MCLESCFLDHCCWRRLRNGYRTCRHLDLSHWCLLCCRSCRPRRTSLDQRCRVCCRWKDYRDSGESKNFRLKGEGVLSLSFLFQNSANVPE
jgi:hypothetical protein